MKRESHSSSSEKKVMAYLGAKSQTLSVRPGTKAAADMRVSFSTGTVWNVQVKACHRYTAAAAYKGNALPPRGIEYRSAKTGRKLTPPGSKK